MVTLIAFSGSRNIIEAEIIRCDKGQVQKSRQIDSGNVSMRIYFGITCHSRYEHVFCLSFIHVSTIVLPIVLFAFIKYACVPSAATAWDSSQTCCGIFYENKRLNDTLFLPPRHPKTIPDYLSSACRPSAA